MEISDLMKLVAPPAAAPAAVSWAGIEELLGRLPADYKAFVDAYGGGAFWGELGVCGPEWIVEHGAQPLMVAELHDLAGQAPGYALVAPEGEPAVCGTAADTYLAWGGAGGGQIGFWRTTGEDPDSWPVVVSDGTGVDFEPGGLVAYLVGVLGGSFESVAMPADWVVDCRGMGAAPFTRY